MANIKVQGLDDATYASQVNSAVAKYAEANPTVSVADKVVLDLVDPTGKPCQVEGTFRRGKYGEVIFTVINLIQAVKKAVKAVKDAVKGAKADRPRTPSAKRAARREAKGGGRFSGLQAIYNGTLPSDPEKRLEYFLQHDLVRKDGAAYVMAGGKRFADRNAVIAFLADQVHGDAATDGQQAPAPTETAAPAPKADKKAAKVEKKAAKAVKAKAKVEKKAAKAVKKAAKKK